MPPQDPGRSLGLVRPGPAVTGVMILLGGLWLVFALAVNWGGAHDDLFLLFCGNTQKILHGQVWRLFTAPLMHTPRGTLSHILFALLGLVFLAPSLEQRWGGARTLRFLLFSGVIAYGIQMALELMLPASVSERMVGDYWYGSFPVIDAVAVAWALSFRGQTVRLWFVLPVTATAMLLFIGLMSLLRIVADSSGPEGLLSPFGGMFAGWLLGGSTPSPLRRVYLKLKLAQLDHEAAHGLGSNRRQKKDSRLRVIEGGRGKGPSDDGSNGSGRMLH